MFFRRLNWNVVGWFRTVSRISYIIIGVRHRRAGVACDPCAGRRLPTLPRAAAWACRSPAAPTSRSSTRRRRACRPCKRALAETRRHRRAGQHASRKSSDAAPNERFTVETQRDFGNDPAPLWAALGTVGQVDRAQSQIAAVGPSLGKEYLTKAGEALVIAIAIQFIYIAFRFGWNYIFGLVVVIALVRDAAMMIGIYAIADKPADDAFLAAVLTVIGYSVMDTIVILDRIRENVKVMAGEPYAKIVNTSILQTMTRSFNTLATVVITLVALLAFGGASLQNFAFALLVGHLFGRLPFDLLLRAAGQRAARAAIARRGYEASVGARDRARAAAANRR